MTEPSEPHEAPAAAPPRSWPAWLSAVPALLALVLAYWRQPGFGLLSDAEFLLRDNATLHRWGSLWAQLTHDYFWSSSGERINYWRPVTRLSWLVEYQLGGGRAWVFLATQLAYFALATLGVHALSRRLGVGALGAGLAALVFALHPAAVEPVCLAMARSDVAVVAFSLWSLVGLLGWRAGGGRKYAALHLGMAALALGSKESGVALVPAALLVAWGPPRRLSLAAAMLALLGVYLALRRAVLGPLAHTTVPFDPLRWFVGMGAYLRGLVPLQLSTGVRNMPRAEAMQPAWLAGSAGLVLAALAGLAVALRRRRDYAAVLLWALGSLLAVLLPHELNMPDTERTFALADRWLLPAAATSCVLLGALAEKLGALPSRLGSRALLAALALWAAGSLAVAWRVRAPYHDGISLLEREEQDYLATPEDFRTPAERCQQERRGLLRAQAAHDPQGVLLRWDRLRQQGCPNAAADDFNVLAQLVALQRWAEAAALSASLAHARLPQRVHGPFAYLRGRIAMARGDFAQARAEFLVVQRLGLSDCALPLRLAQCSASLGERPRAASELRAAIACRLAHGDTQVAPLESALRELEQPAR